METINLLFLIGSCCALLSNCYRTYQDKGVKGISFFNVIFFTFMASYQTCYWYSLGKMFSFVGCAFTALIQGVWLGMIVYYRNGINEKIESN
jgi:hypothetical protein